MVNVRNIALNGNFINKFLRELLWKTIQFIIIFFNVKIIQTNFPIPKKHIYYIRIYLIHDTYNV